MHSHDSEQGNRTSTKGKAKPHSFRSLRRVLVVLVFEPVEEMSADFRDFDDPVEFHRLVKKAKHPNSENFVIDFSHDKARCAFDVDESQVNGLLRTEVRMLRVAFVSLKADWMKETRG